MGERIRKAGAGRVCDGSTLNPAFLFAAAAVAVPLWLHLSRRRKYRELEIGTLRFLRLFCAEVLTDEGGTGDAEAEAGEEGETFDAQGSTMGGKGAVHAFVSEAFV